MDPDIPWWMQASLAITGAEQFANEWRDELGRFARKGYISAARYQQLESWGTMKNENGDYYLFREGAEGLPVGIEPIWDENGDRVGWDASRVEYILDEQGRMIVEEPYWQADPEMIEHAILEAQAVMADVPQPSEEQVIDAYTDELLRQEGFRIQTGRGER